MDQEDPVINVTPEILSSEVVGGLIDYLIAKSRENGYSTIFEYLSEKTDWTEYTLYWLFLLEFHKKEKYYIDRQGLRLLHSDDNVWTRDQVPDGKVLREQIDAAFQREDGGLFLVIQSACMPLEEYQTIVGKYLS